MPQIRKCACGRETYAHFFKTLKPYLPFDVCDHCYSDFENMLCTDREAARRSMAR
jgi:hypothetical protein